MIGITGTTHPLPFDILSPSDFERLCFWLVEREGYQQAEHLGAVGGEQGRDIIARWQGKRVAFQCKRVNTFGPKDVLKEVDKLLGLTEADRPDIIVFIVTCNVSATARDAGRHRSNEEKIEIQFWVSTELDAKVKKYPEIVKEFFQTTIENTGSGQENNQFKILFDESHGQGKWWNLTPTIHKDFKEIADIAGNQIEVKYISSGKNISRSDLNLCKLLVLAIGPHAETKLSSDEMKAIHGYLRDGGHLLVLSTYTGDWHHEANLNELLLDEYGIYFNRDVILPEDTDENDAREQADHYHPSSKYAVETKPADFDLSDEPPLLPSRDALVNNIKNILTLSCCSLYVNESNAFPILEAQAECKLYEPVPLGIGIRIDRYKFRGRGPATVMAASRAGNVIAIGGWKMFTNDFISDQSHDNKQLFINILRWAVNN